MNLFRNIIAIPARLESSRLPNKVLKDICGKTMIQRVLENCSQTRNADLVVLCTDNCKLKLIAEELGYKVFMTSKKCESGTDRIASIIKELIEYAWSKNSFGNLNFQDQINQTLIVNVQGDQPFINPKIIERTFQELRMLSNSTDVITPIYKLSKKNIHNPNVVKTLIRNDGSIIYFSRSAIPHIRDIPSENWHKFNSYWGHAGIYGFRAKILVDWGNLQESNLEKLEKLEQLRIIDNGYNISSFATNEECFSIDTKEQLLDAIEKANVEKSNK
tara:strand:- start:16 stop:837 length:822 start_codon:yes stop_codon:yes gene_type:complete